MSTPLRDIPRWAAPALGAAIAVLLLAGVVSTQVVDRSTTVAAVSVPPTITTVAEPPTTAAPPTTVPPTTAPPTTAPPTTAPPPPTAPPRTAPPTTTPPPGLLKGDGFSVDLQDDYEEQASKPMNIGPITVTSHTYIAEVGDVALIVSYADFSRVAPGVDPAALMRAVTTDQATTIGLTFQTLTDSTFRKLPALDARGTSTAGDDLHFSERLIYAGKRLYELSALGDTAAPPPAYTKMLASLRIG